MFTLFLQEIWKVLLYSLLLGAGLPVLYAVGVRAAAYGSTSPADGSTSSADGTAVAIGGPRRLLGRSLAVICFVVVLAGIGLGLAYIVAAGHGEQLSFHQGYPTFVPKG